MRGEVEKLEGRRRYLDQRVAFSSVSITLEETDESPVLSWAEFWQFEEVARQSGRNLLYLARFLLHTLLYTGWLLALFLPLWLYYRESA